MTDSAISDVSDRWAIQRCAHASWLAPVASAFLAIAVMPYLHSRVTVILVGTIPVVLVLSGFYSGLWAVFGALRFGRRSLLFPAAIGLLLNGLIINFALDVIVYD